MTHQPEPIPDFLRRREGDAKAPPFAKPRFNAQAALARDRKRRAAEARRRRRQAEAVRTKALAVWHGGITTAAALDALEKLGLDRLSAAERLAGVLDRLKRAGA